MSITLGDKLMKNFLLGFIRIHLIHHAAKEPFFGLDMIRELSRHGYDLSPGTLYPILHGLEREGYLVTRKETVNGKVRKYYLATELGKDLIKEAKSKTRELIEELNEP